jgi:hypothetical protein
VDDVRAAPTYEMPAAFGGGTVRLHGNSEDTERGLNRTENVRPILWVPAPRAPHTPDPHQTPKQESRMGWRRRQTHYSRHRLQGKGKGHHGKLSPATRPRSFNPPPSSGDPRIMGKRPGPYNNGAWRAVRQQALARDGNRCQECGKAGKLDVDHIVPWKQAGHLWYELSNLRSLCRSCHIKKTYRQGRGEMTEEEGPSYPKPPPRVGPDGRSLGMGTPSREW